MTKKIFEQEYKITTLNINPNKKLGLFGLLGFLQDIASEHAYLLNFGYETMKEKGFFWVLARQKLKINIWPEWHDSITIKTWTLPLNGFYAIREFEIYLNNKKIGECSSTWMILDSNNRRPKEVDKEALVFLPRTDYQLNFTANKIKLPDDLSISNTLIVRYSDLDVINHVNNVKYSQWILDSMPPEFHKESTINEFEINFLNETFLEDKIECYNNVANARNGEYFFMGKNAANGKIAFIAKINDH